MMIDSGAANGKSPFVTTPSSRAPGDRDVSADGAGIVGTVLVLLAVAMPMSVVAGCNGGSAKDGSKELKLAFVMAPGGAAHQAVETFARLVKEKTDGKITVKLFPSAQLGNDSELADLLSAGGVDFVLGGTAPIGWSLPEYGAIEAPFIFRDYEHLDKVLRGRIGNEIVDAMSKKRGIKILDWWHRGPRYLTTADRKVTKPADLKGLKLRIPQLKTYLEAWDILGADTTPITYSEIFMSLRQGIVEGQENPLEVIYTGSYHEVQKYLMKTEHLLGVYMLMTNEAMFNSLPNEHQEAIRQAALEAGRLEHALMEEFDRQFLTKLQEKGMELVDVDREAFRRAIVRELPKRFEDIWAPGFFERIIQTK